MGTGQNPSSGQNPLWPKTPPAKTPLRPKPPSGNPPLANPPPPSGQNSPPAKIPLWPKPPSDKKSPPEKKTSCQPPHLTLINKYHPKLRLFYIKFRLCYEDNDILFQQ